MGFVTVKCPTDHGGLARHLSQFKDRPVISESGLAGKPVAPHVAVCVKRQAGRIGVDQDEAFHYVPGFRHTSRGPTPGVGVDFARWGSCVASR
jgi:hypothetical protein